MTTALLENISKHRSEQKDAALREYGSLVLQVESGVDDIEAKTAIHILEAAGKTEKDLNSSVARVRQRRLDAPLAACLNGIAAESESTDRELFALNERFAAAREQFRIAYDSITTRQAQLHAQYFEAQKAAARMRDTCEDSRIIGREKLLGVEMTSLGFEKRSLVESLSASGKEGKRLGQLMAAIRQSAPTNYFGIFTSSASKSKQAEAATQARDEYSRTHIEPLRKRLAAVEARMAVINHELAELSEQKLEA